jgi:hypothetical protein
MTDFDDQTTDDLTECIWKELTTSLGDVNALRSVKVIKGWGDIVYVTIRISSSSIDDCDAVGGKLKSAVARALGEMRQVIRIDWVK